MNDAIEAPPTTWAREIWAAERDPTNHAGLHVFSVHATVSRFVGDSEREAEFHRYVDADIFDSLTKYCAAQLEAERDERWRLSIALRKKDDAMGVLFKLLGEHDIDYSHLIP